MVVIMMKMRMKMMMSMVMITMMMIRIIKRHGLCSTCKLAKGPRGPWEE